MKHTDILLSVFERMRPRLFATARRIVVTDDDALDVLQEAFYKLWKRPEVAKDASIVENLSLTAVKNAAIDSQRRRSVKGISVDIESATDLSTGSPDESDLFIEVKTIIDSALPPRQREVLYMRDYRGMEIEDIATEINTSAANVRVLLSRARHTVREIYKNRLYGQ